MSTKRTSLLAATAMALISSGPVSGAPAGVLVETQLSDPDPGYVPPPAERKVATKHRKEKDPTLDEAFENLGRVAGQAAQILRQREIDRMTQAGSASEQPKE